MIEEKVNQFIKAYNSGDMEDVLDCLSAKKRNEFKAAMNIAQAIGGAVPKIGGVLGKISMSDLFAIGIAEMSEDDVLTISDITVNIISETKATADVTVRFNGNEIPDGEDKAFFTMIKEDNDWFISNFESK